MGKHKLILLIAIAGFLYYCYRQDQAKALPIRLKGSTLEPVSYDDETVPNVPRDASGSIIYGNVGKQPADSIADYMGNPTPQNRVIH